MVKGSSRAHPAAGDKAEDHRRDGQDRADLVGCEVEAERHDEGDHRLDEGEDHRRFAAPDSAGLGVHDVSRHFTRTMSPGWMSPGLARYLAFSGYASRALSVSPCAVAMALRLSPDFTVTVTTGGRRIAFARSMTRLTRASRVAGGQGSLRRLTPLMSACTTTVLRLTGMPSARDAAATRWATLSNWASVKGSGPAPEHSIDSCTHSFMFTPDATAAATVGILVLGEATSPWLQAAYFTGSMARTIVPSRSMYAVAEGPPEPARLA